MIVMKFSPINGDCQLADYTNWITIDDVSWDINREPKESSKGATTDLHFGVAEAGAVNVTKQMDISSVYLMKEATGGGTSPDKCEIHFISSGLDASKKDQYSTFLIIELERPVIKKWGINASGDDRPSESIEIMYNTIKMKYTWFSGGSKKSEAGPAGWDLVGGKAI
jgi:type VI protein secretion system component Hcp